MNLSPFKQHITIAWKLGVRSNAMQILLALSAFLLLIAFLAGAFSMRQPLVVTLDVGISAIRLVTALLTLLWMQEACMRDIERRTVLLAFSQPVDRISYVLGRYVGVMLLISVATLCWGAALALADQFASWGYPQSSRPYLSVSYISLLLGIIVDAWVIGAFVLAVTSVAETPLLPFMVGVIFALCARSIGPVLDYLAYSASVDPDLKANFLNLIEHLRWVLPDLSLLDWRETVLYGQAFPWARASAGLCTATGYILASLTLATWAYRKRELS